MGKSKEEKREKKDKEHRSTTDKVSKKEKKEKKDKKVKKDVVERLYDELTGATPAATKEEKKQPKDESDNEGEASGTSVAGTLELLPFAQPLLEGKLEKKVLKLIKKGAKARLLRRGVKEVVKHVRKLPNNPQPSALSQNPQGFVVLAADISPMDVISHIPVLCEDHSVPYVFISSRAELGKAAGTKRLTSAVACVPGLGKKGEKDGDVGEFLEGYEEVFQKVRDEGRRVPV